MEELAHMGLRLLDHGLTVEGADSLHCLEESLPEELGSLHSLEESLPEVVAGNTHLQDIGC